MIEHPGIFRYNNHKWLFLAILTIFLFFLNLSIGSVSISLLEIFKVITGLKEIDPTHKEIIINFRLTKSLTCVLAGAALALGGLQMQTLFRNPLAGPDILGLSSGASLAVSLVFMAGSIGFGIQLASWGVAIAACVGSSLLLLIILAITKKVNDTTSLLIVGLMIGAGTTSFVSVLQFISRAEDQQYYLIWTFGSLGGLDWLELEVLAIAFVIGLILLILNLKALNGWLLGNLYAKSIGIQPNQSKLLMILSTSILSGAVTAFCGPIAFVGLAVPHLIRLLLKSSDHKILAPAVAMGGSSLLLLCDCLTHIPGSNLVLPINAITALIGAPIVISIILKGRKIYV